MMRSIVLLVCVLSCAACRRDSPAQPVEPSTPSQAPESQVPPPPSQSPPSVDTGAPVALLNTTDALSPPVDAALPIPIPTPGADASPR